MRSARNASWRRCSSCWRSRINGGKMKDTENIEKIYKAVELLEDFCSETACPDCSIRKICNKIDKNAPIAAGIIKHIER